MTEPQLAGQLDRWWMSLRHIVLHLCATALAVGIAFSLPVVAQYILYQWWPRVEGNPNLLLAHEVALAAVLVVLFNLVGIALERRRKVRFAELASLVHVCENEGRLVRWFERRRIKPLPAVRDGFVLTVTGFDTFADETSLFGEALNNAYEVRVLLLYPYGECAGKRVIAPPGGSTQQDIASEVDSSIARLRQLHAMGKKVSLKFYEHEPLWRIVVLGDRLWVRHCHSGADFGREPEYVFALNREYPRRGFFNSFYMYFLEQWSDPRHPEYDFETAQLVYRDASGQELRRVAFGGDVEPAQRVAPAADPGDVVRWRKPGHHRSGAVAEAGS